VLSAAEQWLKHELTKNFKVIRDLELLPQILGQDWSSVFLQRFDGAVTIWPRTRFWNWVSILSDPDPCELEKMIRGGEIVTWPKLHMIENRFRLEKQIFLGRQAVRRSLQSKTRTLSPESQMKPQADNLPEPVTGTNAATDVPRVSLTPPPSGSDAPMSVDTDTEAALVSGTRWFFKRGHSTTPNSGTSTPRDHGPSQGPSRLPLTRRKWASELLSPASSESNNPSGTPDLPTNMSSSFFNRLRAKSFPTLASSFSPSIKSRLGKEQSTTEPAWSSESSSEDDLSVDSRRIHYSSMNFSPDSDTTCLDGLPVATNAIGLVDD